MPLYLNHDADLGWLIAMPFGEVDEQRRELLLATLEPVAVAISRSGVIRYPNPMGLPALA